MNARLWLGALFSMALLSLAGCGEPHDDLRKFMRETGLDGRERLDPLPPVKPPDTFEYDATGLESPFKARNLRPVKADGGGNAPDLNRPREPLEEFPLDALRMVGTVQKGGRLYAIIRAPDGALHRVTTGNRIGQNFGVIVAIHPETGLRIRETVQDSAGDWIEGEAVLTVK